MFFKSLSILVHWTKVASALEGLRTLQLYTLFVIIYVNPFSMLCVFDVCSRLYEMLDVPHSIMEKIIERAEQRFERN